MLIVCKTCASSYHIPREILGENGCQLRCVGCGAAWAVTSEALEADGASIMQGSRLPAVSAIARAGSRDHQARFGRDGRAERRAQALTQRKSGGANKIATFSAALLMLGSAMGVIAARAAVVRAAPDTARIFAAIGLPVNLRGLALDNVHTNIFDSGDRKVLIVEGAVVNLRDASVDTPSMRIALRGSDKREIYVWTAPAPKAQLGPNERITFRSRLAAPPEDVSDVLVRFAAVGEKLSPVKDGL
jgi:predicted Zn finger-like uncharacterized protein